MSLLPRCAILLSLLILNQWTSILSQGITIEYLCSLTNWPVRCPSTVDPVCASTPRTCSQEPCPQFTEFSNSCNACKTQGITEYSYGKCSEEDTSVNEESTQEELQLNKGGLEECVFEEAIFIRETGEEDNNEDLEQCVFEEAIFISQEDKQIDENLEQCVFEEAILINYEEEGNIGNNESNIKDNIPDGEDIIIEGNESEQIISNP